MERTLHRKRSPALRHLNDAPLESGTDALSVNRVEITPVMLETGEQLDQQQSGRRSSPDAVQTRRTLRNQGAGGGRSKNENNNVLEDEGASSGSIILLSWQGVPRGIPAQPRQPAELFWFLWSESGAMIKMRPLRRFCPCAIMSSMTSRLSTRHTVFDSWEYLPHFMIVVSELES